MFSNAPEPQAVCNPSTRSAIFIVAVLGAGPTCADTVRDWCGDVAAITRSVSKRSPDGNLSCVCGLGSAARDLVCGAPRPAGLHPFREFGSGDRIAPATPGDILLHIRAEDMGLCFELARELVSRLGDAATTWRDGMRSPSMRKSGSSAAPSARTTSGSAAQP